MGVTSNFRGFLGIIKIAAAKVVLGETLLLDARREIRNALLEDVSPSSRSILSSPFIEPNLTFSDINILVVSDVHSFVGGHPHEPDRDANYGDLFSFHERLKSYCEDQSKGDLWLFNNGDWLHGTGLAMNGNSTHLIPILNAMPWDSITMGRQEATYTDVLKDMKETMLPTFPGKYITSNVVWNDEAREPYGARYQLLRGRNSTILVFGFIYDAKSASQIIQIVPVEEAVQQHWFQDALNMNDASYDAIVVMAQIDIHSPLINTIYEKIRENVHPNMPIQFISGHSHKREKIEHIQRDHFVHNIEPGGLFDTIGWVTMPKFEKSQVWNAKTPSLREGFQQEFLNTSKANMHSLLGLGESESLQTPGGRRISQMVHDAQERLELNQIVACPDHDYFRNISIHAENSLWKLWREHVVRTQIFKKNENRVMFVSKRTFRYDLRGSGKRDAMTLDDVVAIAPYMERVIYVGEVPDWMVRRMNNTFNTFSHHNIIPDYVLAGDIDEMKTADSYHLYTHEMDVPKIKTKLEKFNYHGFVLEPTGQRDTLYWLDYIRTAFPCKGIDKGKFKAPYFYDPNALEEEATDGLANDDDDGTEVTEDDKTTNGESDEEMWTLPPDAGYLGYIPGKGETQKVPVSIYENYKSKDEKEKEEQKKREADLVAKKNHGLQSQLKQRKRTKKKMIKGFALTLAGGILLVPVFCLIMQISGYNDSNDDDFGEGGVNTVYDQEEMKLLRRQRKRGFKPSLLKPMPEIEII